MSVVVAVVICDVHKRKKTAATPIRGRSGLSSSLAADARFLPRQCKELATERCIVNDTFDISIRNFEVVRFA